MEQAGKATGPGSWDSRVAEAIDFANPVDCLHHGICFFNHEWSEWQQMERILPGTLVPNWVLFELFGIIRVIRPGLSSKKEGFL